MRERKHVWRGYGKDIAEEKYWFFPLNFYDILPFLILLVMSILSWKIFLRNGYKHNLKSNVIFIQIFTIMTSLYVCNDPFFLKKFRKSFPLLYTFNSRVFWYRIHHFFIPHHHVKIIVVVAKSFLSKIFAVVFESSQKTFFIPCSSVGCILCVCVFMRMKTFHPVRKSL